VSSPAASKKLLRVLNVLLTNDDGIFAPGLRAHWKAWRRIARVEVVAPKLEQSGVSHAITYLQPLIVQEVFEEGGHYGWEVAGSPADCVKLAMLELCPFRPDLVVSGINGGANLGINVLYSGTVAAAIEGAFFDVTSVAVSLAMSAHPDFEGTARRSVELIQRLLEQQPPTGSLWNVNFPPGVPRGYKVLPMGVERYGEKVEKRFDPRGRTYYWSGIDTQFEYAAPPGTDVEGVLNGFATITPLQFDLTHRARLAEFQSMQWTDNLRTDV
jgi:5'-nucleotidase